jgi:hypothetical protein
VVGAGIRLDRIRVTHIGESMTRKRIQRIATAAIVAGNALLWLFPSNVAYLIAREKEVLLGRYSEGRLAGMLVSAALSLLALYLIRSQPVELRQRARQVAALFIGTLAGLVIAESVLLLIRSPRYIKTGDVYHRPPRSVYTELVRDVPCTRHSYPCLKTGHPDVRCTLTVDAQGFRNRSVPNDCDVVVLGDSFAEGSNVSDGETWSALYGALSGRRVYNLGMAGGNPDTYVETLRKFGIRLSPEVVVCLLYEGNDFRGSGQLVEDRLKERAAFRERLKVYYKVSPVRLALKRFLIAALSFRSCVGGAAPGSDAYYAISWLPLAVPEGPRAKYYAFNIRRLVDCCAPKAAVAESKGCRTVFLALREMKELCRECGARLLVLFAPDAPHVVMPLARERLDPGQVRAFLALKMDDLPPPPEAMTALFSTMDAREELVREFCDAEGIEFLSLTQPLRAAVERGTQAYFTYDEHWTPTGHRIVALELKAYLERAPMPGRVEGTSR